MRITTLVAVVLLVLLVSCGGGSFTPDNGPFYGQFLVSTTSNGNFSFTVNGGALGGTGSIVHNEQPVVVTISANVYGTTISGVIQNANLGSGTFTGQFDQHDQAYGTYTYADAAGLHSQNGTWTALSQ